MANPRLHPNFAKSKPLTAARLREIYEYFPETGMFCRRRVAGEYDRKATGHLTPGHAYGRYLGLGIDYRRYYCHRLAWLWIHGEWPEHEIDHINGDPYDNRLSNLRAATKSENGYNKRRGTRNTSGIKGVHFFKPSGKWRAAINDGHRRRKHLGLFDTKEQAAEAYRLAAIRLFGVFAKPD
jgi:hypothetical protein